MKRIFTFTLIVLVLFTLPCWAQENPEWYLCQSDNQCAVVYACGDHAANPKHVDDVRRKFGDCRQNTLFHDPDSFAQCIKGQCAVVHPAECQADNDCVVLQGCHDSAHNIHVARQPDTGSSCLKSEHDPNAIAQCIYHYCALVSPAKQ